MLLVVGGSGSGKSAYAENVLSDISKKKNLKTYYIATMQVFDEEGCTKVKRHRRLRQNKGFTTIEQPVSIHKALEKMEVKGRAALVECISNLTANEMFSGEITPKEMDSGEMTLKETDPKETVLGEIIPRREVWQEALNTGETIVRKIVREIKLLREEMDTLIVVTNNVFEDGVLYDESVMEYIEVMGQVNKQLAAMADKVVEVVMGVPMVIK